jgi:hypothetical protein
MSLRFRLLALQRFPVFAIGPHMSSYPACALSVHQDVLRARVAG